MHPDFCFVLEDDSGICGYAVCVPDVKEFQLRLESEWLVKMREKYPDPCPNKQEDLTATEVRMYTDSKIKKSAPQIPTNRHTKDILMSFSWTNY